MNKGSATAFTILFVVVVLSFAYLYLNPGTPISEYTTVYVRITDPPIIPKGTSSINITYSEISLQVRNSTGTSWINSSEDGSINLLALQNQTETVSSIDLPSGTTPVALGMNITSGSITINGTEYLMDIVSPRINSTIGNLSALPGSKSFSAILSMASSVSPSFAGNSTSFFFRAFPTSVLLSGQPSSSGIGSISRLNSSEAAAIASYTPEIEILSSSLSVEGNSTFISATIKDNSSAPVVLEMLALSGNESMKINAVNPAVQAEPSFGHITDSLLINETFNAINSALGYLINNRTSNLTGLAVSKLASSNITKIPGYAASTASKIALQLNLTGPEINQISSNLNSTQSNSFINGIISNLTGSANSIYVNGSNAASVTSTLIKGISSGKINSSNIANIKNLIANAKAEAGANFPKKIEAKQSQFNYLSFIVAKNSSLIPTISASSITGSNYGYLLEPGRSVTLTYTGNISAGNGILGISLISGNSYKISIIGTNGAYAYTETNAG